MSNKYKIESLGDFLKIPADRIKDCLAELGDHLFAMRQTIDNFGVEPTGNEVKSFTWEDDGKQDLAIKATVGEEVVEVKFTKVESKEG
ncbi:hypothetical protein HN258_04760 [Acinetobacter baumannii]|uniref:hypothetical protein n=1 Tax=Acinetobacter baumannii TaxID=470 RepID=UPI001897BCC2|nr:hypothetical protein [Acinetobacter baumannii]MBF6687479.1 hypothetical protein [Acinetobacter baumannii]MBF6846153.1 hypothetical protein [Acinetobacter baumannii]MBF6916447.1 hypothetical protein [Acinetobacter baumannii]MBF6969322.1 hypothetical protein [Acinetobacter baumannii]